MGGDPLREQADEIVARADGDRPGLDHATEVTTLAVSTARTAVWRRKVTPWRGFQPGRQARDRVARLHAQLVRTPERGQQLRRRHRRMIPPHLGRVEKAALGAHLGAHEGLQHGDGFRPPGGQQQSAMQDRQTHVGRDLGPDLAGASARGPTCRRAPGRSR